MTLLLTLASTAFAVPFTVCVEYTPDFDDSDVVGATEDFYATNSPKPARGLLVRAIGSGGSTVDRYTAVDLQNPCASFDLTAAQTWTIRVASRAEIDAHAIQVRNSKAPQSLWAKTVKTGWTPVAGTYDVALPASGQWQVLAASTQAIIRNDGGLASVNIDYFTRAANGTLYLPGACSSDPCVDGTDVYLGDLAAFRKFRVAYLQGWALLHEMGWSSTDYDITASEDYCGNGVSQDLVLETLENVAAGYLEGFAHWYSASAFNLSSEANCSYTYWRAVNWDQLDVCFENREAATGHVLSCATGPSLPPFEALIPETNYRDYCKERAPGSDAAGAPNPFPSDVIAPLDVVRFFHERVYADAGFSKFEVGKSFNDLKGALPSAQPWQNELQTQAQGWGASGGAWDAAELIHGVDL